MRAVSSSSARATMVFRRRGKTEPVAVVATDYKLVEVVRKNP
jgi:hypothetical protein